MKIKLIFTDWRKWDKDKRCSIYNTEIGCELSMGEFHGGTTFDGEICLTPENEKELTEAIKQGYKPIFCIDLS